MPELITKTVAVTMYVDVTIDADEFTEEWMAEYRESFYKFMYVDEHICHIAQLQARGVDDFAFPTDFVEGYGPIGEMGITARVTDWEEEIR